jgi:hypothetical protein
MLQKLFYLYIFNDNFEFLPSLRIRIFACPSCSLQNKTLLSFLLDIPGTCSPSIYTDAAALGFGFQAIFQMSGNLFR